MRDRLISNPEWDWLIAAVLIITVTAFCILVVRALTMKRIERRRAAELPLLGENGHSDENENRHDGIDHE